MLQRSSSDGAGELGDGAFYIDCAPTELLDEWMGFVQEFCKVLKSLSRMGTRAVGSAYDSAESGSGLQPLVSFATRTQGVAGLAGVALGFDNAGASPLPMHGAARAPSACGL